MANQKGDTVSTGHFWNRCIDAVNKKFETYSFWHKASDCEFDDGGNAQTKVGAFKGITSDLNTTTTGYAADMTTVAKLNSSLGGIKFGVDSDGNYGYIKAGADTVTPFKSGIHMVKLTDVVSKGSVNVSSYPGYQNFTVDNFVFKNVTKAGSSKYSTTSSYKYYSNTGIFTFQHGGGWCYWDGPYIAAIGAAETWLIY